MNMLEAYKDFLVSCHDDEYSLFYFWGDERVSIRIINGVEYNDKWCQDAIDFAYRVTKSCIMSIDSEYIEPDFHSIKKILNLLSENSPNTPDGGAIWSAYQLYLTDAGLELVDNFIISNNNVELEYKLINIFNEHDVGFDKSILCPIKFR